uniref:(California timema) hypothetical protein n=1 Tax=Timema californicum TaxID=61474 RepID=A0A7R9PDQ0_TIMCA|nr:unnamed protein product [Timema californicum]
MSGLVALMTSRADHRIFRHDHELSDNAAIDKALRRQTYSSSVASLVLTDSSQLTSDSQHLGINNLVWELLKAVSCELSVSTKEAMGLLHPALALCLFHGTIFFRNQLLKFSITMSSFVREGEVPKNENDIALLWKPKL